MSQAKFENYDRSQDVKLLTAQQLATLAMMERKRWRLHLMIKIDVADSPEIPPFYAPLVVRRGKQKIINPDGTAERFKA